MAEILLPAGSLVVLVLTTAGVLWRSRDARWVRDAQLALNAQPLLSLIPAAFLLIAAVALVVIGVGSLVSGFVPGWGFFALALTALLLLGFTAWIASRPFPRE